MNKNILGMILVACLLSKSATAMVVVADALPTIAVTDTRSTQEIYNTLLLTQELYRLSPLPLHEFETYQIFDILIMMLAMLASHGMHSTHLADAAEIEKNWPNY